MLETGEAHARLERRIEARSDHVLEATKVEPAPRVGSHERSNEEKVSLDPGSFRRGEYG